MTDIEKRFLARLKKKKYNRHALEMLYRYVTTCPAGRFGAAPKRCLCEEQPVVESRRRSRKTRRWLCAECGKPLPSQGYFCKNCGRDNYYTLIFGRLQREAK